MTKPKAHLQTNFPRPRPFFSKRTYPQTYKTNKLQKPNRTIIEREKQCCGKPNDYSFHRIGIMIFFHLFSVALSHLLLPHKLSECIMYMCVYKKIK